jgi:anaerobic selenocysteine-containing dehydrogenase
MAKALGGTVAASFPWKNYGEALKARAVGLFESGKGLTGYDPSKPVWRGLKSRGAVNPDYSSFDDMWRKIKSGGLWHRPSHHFRNWESVFKTPTGKFEFSISRIELAVRKAAKGGTMNAALRDMGVRARGDQAFLPHYEETAPGVDPKKYPLLMLPYPLVNLSSTWTPSPPHLKKNLFDHQLLKDESFADINPDTALEHNLRQGDRVIIESPEGKLSARVNLFEGAMPGVVYLPLGLGHSAYDAFMQDKGANPNKIVDAAKDPLSGHPIWWRTRVRITKA